MAAVTISRPPLTSPYNPTVSGTPSVPLSAAEATAAAIERLNAAFEGKYVVERELGRGGMATVYLARDPRHDREVAIKVLLPELSASIGGDRFEREIKVAARLQHPHILGLFDSGSALGLLYYVMPFVKGESLRDRLDREGQLPVEDALLITLEVADALGYAHKQDIIHRDIKPENIMLTGGHALVADFGIARAASEGAQKLTQTGMALGTPLYMSPEQSAGEQVGPQADVYSLACVLYEMLAGEPPFGGKNAMAIMARHVMEQVPSIRIVRSAVPEEIEAAIYAGMEKSPVDRPKTAQQFAEILGMPMGMTATLRVTGPTTMRRVPSGAQLAIAQRLAMKPWWRRPAVLAGGAAVLIAGATGGWFAMRGGKAAADPNARRVAVLYFTDASSKKDLGPIADGLTEGLISSLSTASSVTVISRAGVERFRGSSLAPDSISRVLRVGYLVRGDVDRDGQNIVVNVRLEDHSGVKLEKRSLRIPETNQLAMGDSLGTAVSALIKGTLHADIVLHEERAGTSSQAAWLELQRGEQSRKSIDALAKGDTMVVNRAVAATDSMLAHAAALDPKWAEPVTRRALLAYQRSRAAGADIAQIRHWVELAIQHADSALEIDKDSPDALEIRGNSRYWSFIKNLETDATRKQALLVGARADLERATELNPKQAGAYATLSVLYNQVPGFSNSQVYIAATKAYEADEFLSAANVVLHRLFFGAYDLAQFDQASQHCKVFASRFPQDYRSKRCQLFMLTVPTVTKVDFAAARRLADSSVALRAPKDSLMERLNTNLLIAAAMAQLSKQQPAFADSAVRITKASLGDARVDPNRDQTFYAGFVFGILGRKEDALNMLEEYLAVNRPRVAVLRDDPGWWYKPVQDEPRFKRLVGAP